MRTALNVRRFGKVTERGDNFVKMRIRPDSPEGKGFHKAAR